MNYRRISAIIGHALLLALSASTAIKVEAQTGTLTSVYSFTGSANPTAPLVQGLDKNLYGVAYNGGASSKGSIFKVAAGGAVTTLHEFAANGSDGVLPFGGLTLAPDGNLYGAASQGGVSNYGVIYEYSLVNGFSVVYAFGGNDGAFPYSTLTVGSDGYLYGTVFQGGGQGANGAVFKLSIATPHVYSLVHGFSAADKAGQPYGGVVEAPDGNFYGGTNGNSGATGYGTVYRVTPTGGFTRIHTFTGSNVAPVDGALAVSSLVLAPDGYLYGVTSNGGSAGTGTVYKVGTDGSYALVHSFTGGVDGQTPIGGLLRASDGNLYGTTTGNGAGSTTVGTIYKVTMAGALSTIYSFPSSGANGSAPQDALIQASDGNFYGTTQNGGTAGFGTVFLYHTGLTLARRYNYDLNGDGSDDLLFQSQSNGDVAYANLQGVTPIANSYGYVFRLIDRNWHVVGQPDFNQDGQPDLLWQNVSTGDVVYHLMNGIHYTAFGHILDGVDLQWKIVGTPDLNGDGYPDIVWQSIKTGDVIYNYMKGVVPIATSYGYIFHGIPTQWKIVGTPDLNGDGHPDMVFQNSVTGQISYTLMNGINAIPNSSGFLFPGLDPAWKIVGTPDLNRDGNPDFLFQNSTSGDMSYTLMQGLTPVGSGYIYRGLNLDLRIVGDH